MTVRTIIQAVSGVPRPEAIKNLAAAIVAITSEMSSTEMAGYVADTARIVPAIKRKNDPFAPVWEYLKTVAEYNTGKALHAELITKFGRENTPSLSNLYKYLKENGGKR